jgi:hypothetical protein
MERVRDYQRSAAECLLLSEEVADPVAKGRLLAMAQGWARLADLAEKNARTDVVYETPAQPTRSAGRRDWQPHPSGEAPS